MMKNEHDESEYPPLSSGASTLLQIPSQNKRLPPISTTICQDEFERASKKWSEGTSTSPSGLHLGHYRYPFGDDGHGGYIDDDPDPGSTIMKVYFHVATAALNWGGGDAIKMAE
jgi:hypothetical protein